MKPAPLKQLTKTKEVYGHPLTLSGYRTDNYYNQVMRPEAVYDDDLLLALKAATKADKSGGQILDVGANLGYVSCMLGRFNPKAKIHSFEPVLSNVSVLEKNVKQNHIKAEVHPFGLGAEEQSSMVSWDPGNRGSAFVSKQKHEIYPGQEPITIKVLDKEYKGLGINSCSLIKLDVEGYELEFLRGAKGFLHAYKPTVIMEANHWCLNALQNITLPQFLDELMDTFEYIHGFWGNNLIDVKKHKELYMHENIVNNRYMNLICSFDSKKHSRLLSIYSKLSADLNRDSLTSDDHSHETTAKLIRQQLRIAELEASNRELHMEVDRIHSLKWQFKNMYATVDNRIMTSIDRRGYGVKSHKKNIPVKQPKNRDQLSKAAQEHDINKYFRYNSARPTMKLRYRVLSKGYRVSRDLTKNTVKKTYRLAKRAK